jgi:ATP/maltotriose-dependent transcriptional regulator MalT
MRAVAGRAAPTAESGGEMEDQTRNDDVREFALRLQQALRDDPATGTERWRAAVEDGLSRAYAAGDIVALCDVVQAIVSLLDAQGRLRDAASEVSHAIALAGRDPNALAMLHSMSATLLAACGELPAAHDAVKKAEDCLSAAEIPFAVAKCRANCTVARLLALDSDAVDLSGFELGASADARAADALFLMSYLIPYQLATGARADAHPWLRTFRLQASAANHEYRLADVRLFEAAEAAIAAPLEPRDPGEISRWHWLGNWRAGVLHFRQQLLRRNWAEAEMSLQALLRARRRAGQAQLDPIDGFEMLLMALLERADGGRAGLHPPQSVHLLNLPSTFAAAEAVALDGSQSAAAAWYQWFESRLPAAVLTSMEWPVSRWRLQALLALRAGNERAAKRDLEHAVQWAADAAYPVEFATAQVQLSELLRHRGVGTRRAWRELRQGGSDSLRAAGLDATAFAYAVARTPPALSSQGLVSRLTPRESEVLGYLAEGLSYRAAADLMGVKWTTVQTLTHRCYEKLEASGRRAAIEKAREMGVL